MVVKTHYTEVILPSIEEQVKKRRPFQVRQFVKNETKATKRRIALMALFGSVVMFWIFICLTLMIFRPTIWNTVALYMMLLLAVVVLIAIINVEALYRYNLAVEKWFRDTKADHEQRKRGIV